MGIAVLLFLAYQTSIENQFEFVIKNWLNDPDFKDPGSGHDPILGQSDKNGSRERFFLLSWPTVKKEEVRLKKDWVIPTAWRLLFLALYPCVGSFERLRRLDHARAG